MGRASANEIMADLVRTHQLQLMRFTTGQRNELYAVLEDLARELAGKVVAILPEYTTTVHRYKTTPQLKRLIEESQDLVESRFDEYYKKYSDELVRLSIFEGKWTVDTIEKASGLASSFVSSVSDTILTSIVTKNYVTSEGSLIKDMVLERGGKFAELFIKVVSTGLIAGKSNYDIAKSLKGTIDEAGLPVPGIVELSKRGAEALVRTTTNSVLNDARMLVYQENSDLLKGYQHVSTLDARTTLICAVRDGLTWDLEGKPNGHEFAMKVPPLHINCRSVLIPVLKSFRDLGIPMDDITTTTRASMDGQVSAKLTFEEWISGKSEAFKEKYLGKGRYELWKSGRISFKDLVDQNGRVLTLEELIHIAG